MSSPRSPLLDSLRYIAAPMVNQSDLPFRALVHEHGCTTSYTQMFTPAMLADPAVRDVHLRDMQRGHAANIGPVVAQLAGNDVESLVKAAREIVPWVDGIDLNLGCPQEHAIEGHYGAYMLGRKDWPLIEQIVSALSASLDVPVSTKLRLCTPSALTPVLAERICAAGASFITLHARYPSARRRRHGPAELSVVKALVEDEKVPVPVISNGNVRTWSDIEANLEYTKAKGVMVGEALLTNPCLFNPRSKLSPLETCLSYARLCQDHPDTAPMKSICMHIRHILDAPYGRKAWYKGFRNALEGCKTVEDIELLLRKKGQQWMSLDVEIVDNEGED